MDSEKTARDVATHLALLSLYYRLSVKHGPGRSSVGGGVGRLRDYYIPPPMYLQDLETTEIMGGCVDAIKIEIDS